MRTLLFAIVLAATGCTSPGDRESLGVRTLVVSAEVGTCRNPLFENPEFECMLGQFEGDAERTAFDEGIGGFEWEPGREYVLEVETFRLNDPPADASDTEYTLVRVVE